MSLDPAFQCDGEFLKLMTHRSDIDLTVASLELARDAYPDLDFHTVLDWIAERGRELSARVARVGSERDALIELGRLLSGEHRLHGEPCCYDDPEASYLHRVIETGRGLPISLSVLSMAVAREAGLELVGVSAPMHFLTRYESVEGPLFIDAFSGGRVMKSGECRHWLRDLTGLPLSDLRPTLRPVGPKPILIRMLGNLKALHVRRSDWQAAWLVQHRLTALQPESYEERRDLALISIRANRPGHAIELLNCCLRTCPETERIDLQTQLVAAQSELARWN